MFVSCGSIGLLSEMLRPPRRLRPSAIPTLSSNRHRWGTRPPVSRPAIRGCRCRRLAVERTCRRRGADRRIGQSRTARHLAARFLETGWSRGAPPRSGHSSSRSNKARHASVHGLEIRLPKTAMGRWIRSLADSPLRHPKIPPESLAAIMCGGTPGRADRSWLPPGALSPPWHRDHGSGAITAAASNSRLRPPASHLPTTGVSHRASLAPSSLTSPPLPIMLRGSRDRRPRRRGSALACWPLRPRHAHPPPQRR